MDVNFNFADSVNISSEKIAFPVTGSADYVLTAFRFRSNTVAGTWCVYSDFSNNMSIRLPVFPSDLKSAIDLTFISVLKKTQVTFVENKQIGYEGFYASLLQKKDAQIDPISEQRQKTYLFGNGFYEVSLGARKANGFKQPPSQLPDLASQTNPVDQDQ